MTNLTSIIFRSRKTRAADSSPRAEAEELQAAPLPEGPVILQLMGSLGLNRGGLTKAVYARTSILATDKRVIFASLAHQFDYPEVFEASKRTGQIPAHSELRHFHGDIEQNGRVGNPQETRFASLMRNEFGIDSTVEEGPQNLYKRFFHRGSFIAMECRSLDGRLIFTDHHDEHRPWIVNFRDRYDAEGRIRVREYMNEEFKPRYKIFYNQNGGEYLSLWVSPTGYEYRAVLYRTDDSSQYKDLRAVHRIWLKGLVKEFGDSVLFSDEPTTAFALSINLPGCKKVGSIHTTHYANHVDASEGLKGWVPHYVRAFGTLDRLVFFTKSQLEDFRRDTNCPPTLLCTVPHAAPKIDDGQTETSSVHDSQLMVVVSRMDKDKRLDHIVQAFNKAKQDHPRLRLEIYGSGPEEENLKKLVTSLGASDSISFNGYTSDPISVFRSAGASIMASRYEGFGLVITESMACGTPVISYDTKYGPHELIKDKINGRLVENGNINELAAAIVESSQNSGSSIERRLGALATANEYSIENWKRNWQLLVSQL